MHSIARKFAFRPGEWVLFIRAYLWLFRARRLMKRAHGRQWLFGDGSDALSGKTTNTAEDLDWALIKKRVAAISRASRYPMYWAYCLQRALALREWLAGDGIEAEVKYGVRRTSGKFEAHAWVVCEGKIVNDSVRHVSTYAPLRTLDDYGADSRGKIQNALVASRTQSENAGDPA